MSDLERITQGSHTAYYSHLFFIAYAFEGQVHVFAGPVKNLSHLSCRTSAIFNYFCPLDITEKMSKFYLKYFSAEKHAFHFTAK